MFQITLPGSFQIPEVNSFKFKNATLGTLISELLKYLYPLAGLILLVMIIAGGFEFLTAAGNPETIKKAKSRITSALIGFFILFVSFWLIQIIQAVFGLEKIF